MKVNHKIYLVAIIALGFGIGLGYYLFGNQADTPNAVDTNTNPPTATEEIEYTCSMHPQVRQFEFGICPICEMDLTPLAGNTSTDPLVLEMTKESVKLANIQTSKIGDNSSDGTANSLRLSGKIQADERLATTQTAHVSGRIEQLFVTYTGEEIKQGQKLATIYSPDLITAQRELLEAVKIQDINPSLLEAAKNKLRYLKFGEEMIADIETRGTVQETFTVFADKSGIITNKKVNVGEYIKQGQSLFELINLSRLWVLFDVYEGDLSKVKVGDQVEFETPSLPDQIFRTTVTFIDPSINPQTRVAAMRGEIKNTKKVLKPEMLLTGNLKEKKSTSNATLSVPKSAVLWTGKRSVVYVKMPDVDIPSFQFREVEIGKSMGDSYEVLSGLKQGEEVVTYGSFTIDAAAQLNNQASMMNRNVKIKEEVEFVEIPDYVTTTPLSFKQQLEELVVKYIDTKNALVLTDATKGAEAAKGFFNTLKNTKNTLKEESAKAYWQQQRQAMETHSQILQEKTDIEAQRKQFSFMSEALINSLKAFGVAETEIHIQHCPMAFDNEGGNWLSLETEIQNPYFGDKMMKCGIVKETIGL